MILDGGKSAGIYDFDGASAPKLAQEIRNKDGEVFFGAAVLKDGFIMISARERMRISSRTCRRRHSPMVSD